MGDSGAYLLGYILSVLPLLGSHESNSFATLGAAVTLLTIPIMDTASAIFRRIKEKKSIGSPDREHIHHKLLDIGLKDRRIILVAYSYSLFLSAASIVAVIIRNSTGFFVLIGAWAASITAYILLTRARKAIISSSQ